MPRAVIRSDHIEQYGFGETHGRFIPGLRLAAQEIWRIFLISANLTRLTKGEGFVK